MAHRHKMHEKHKKASGGKVHDHAAVESGDDYSGTGEPDVVKEAKKKKHGGEVGKAHGHKGHHRLDKRARGGRIGKGGGDCTKSPFTAAHVTTSGDA